MRKSRFLLGGLVLALGAGSASVAAAPKKVSVRPFGKPVVASATEGFEPGINVSLDGRTVYIDVATGVPSGINDPADREGTASLVVKSTDGGRTFKPLPVGLRGTHLGGGDADITIDHETGAIAMTDLWLGSSTVSTSTDGGQTWLSNPVQGTLGQDRQWLAAARDGRVYHVTHQLPAGIVVSASVDGGLTYPRQHLAATVLDQTGCVCTSGTMVVRAGDVTTDKIAVAYPTSTGGVKVARSVNSGLTWTNNDIAAPVEGAETLGAFPVLATPGGDRIVAVWLEQRGGNAAVKFAASNDWGATWSAPRVLARGGTSIMPWVDARGGKVAVTLLRTSATGAPAAMSEGTRWYVTYLESRDLGRTWSAPLVVDRTPVKTGPICLDGLACESDRELGEYQSVALDAQGFAHIAYARSIDGSRTETRYVRQR